MVFGTVIKKLRHEHDMTQEKLAEYLNISPQAVSRWETEVAMPDVSLLPILANLFDVTTDYLLGVDITNKDKEIKEICERADKSESPDDNNNYVIEILRDGLCKYPNSWKLKENLMRRLHCANAGPQTEENYTALREAVSLGEEILAGCIIDAHCYGAMQVLCCIYPILGENEKAIVIANNLPDMFVTKDELLVKLLDSNEQIEALKGNIMTYAILIEGAIKSLVFAKANAINQPFTQEQKIELLEKVVRIYDVLLESDDRRVNGMNNIHRIIAEHYAQLKDVGNTLLHLEAEANIWLTALNEPIQAPSMLITEYYISTYMKQDRNMWHKDQIKKLFEKMGQDRYDFVRNAEKFIEMEKKLKEALK